MMPKRTGIAPDTAVILAGTPTPLMKGMAQTDPILLLPVLNHPLVEHQAAALSRAGVQRLLIILSPDVAKAAVRIKDLFRDADTSLHVECIVQEIPRGTAGSLKAIEGELHDRPFWTLNGNLFFDLDLDDMMRCHAALDSAATVAVLRVEEPVWEMERIELDATRCVRTIHRIHPAQNRRSVLRPIGLYLFDPVILDAIPKRGHFDLKEQLFAALTAQGTPAQVWEVPGYCLAIVSVSDYFSLNRDLLMGRARMAAMSGGSAAAPTPRARWAPPTIAPTATILEPVVIGASASIQDNALVIGPTVIGENAVIESGVVLQECLVLPDTRIGQGARLSACITGEGAQVGRKEVLRNTLVLDRRLEASDLTPMPGRYLALNATGLMRSPYCRARSRRIALAGKRIFDLVCSATGLILTAPLMALIALGIKLDSEGPVLFRQRRCTIGGQEFTMIKFRSMVANSEELKRELLSANQVDGPMFKIVGDPRVTRFGRFLRRSNFDELPQLWNALKGEMSLVGPRPLSMEEMRFHPRWRDIRLSVLPGLTGLWQVEAHDKVSFAEWLRYDVTYVRRMSPWLDLKILLKTLFAPSEGGANNGTKTGERRNTWSQCGAGI